MGTETKVFLPDLGDFHDVSVIEVLVAPGDRVAAEGSLLTLESDKATMEIPSPHAGTVKAVAVKVGDKISQGHLIAVLDVEEGAPQPAETAPASVPAPPEPAAEEVEQVQAPAPAPTAAAAAERLPGEKQSLPRPVIARPSDAPPRHAHASPAVRRFARELGVSLDLVRGTGAKGRVLKEDVQGYVKRVLSEGAPAAAAGGGALALPTAPEVDWSRFGAVAEQPLPRIRRLSGAHLHRCWLTVPHVTQFDEADITDLEAFRQARKADAGARLTLMPFLMKAVTACLRAMPQFNSALSADGERLIVRSYVHVGVAVDTPNGLVVPVIRDVDRKGVLELSRELAEVSSRAREGKLLPGDMQGGCFSISSLGGIGGVQFTPIVNAPEVAILGVSRAATKPVWDGAAFAPRLVLPFSLSYDHRVIDGADGVRFTTLLSQLLGDVRRLLL